MHESALSESDLDQSPSVAALLERRAELTPSRTFLRTAQGDISYADAWLRVSSLAAGLRQVGVEPGDVVGMLISNGTEFVETWYATVALAAVSAPLNTGLTGTVLAELIKLCEARVLVVESRLVHRVLDAIPEDYESLTIVVVGKDSPDVGDDGTARGNTAVRLVGYEGLAATSPAEIAPQAPGALAQLLFTSGTSGSVPSGCMVSNAYAVNQATAIIEWLKIDENDVLYGGLPMFHVACCKLATAAAMVGGVFAPGEWFDIRTFWSRIRETRTTIFPYAGATVAALWNEPPSPDDTDNPVRLSFGVPIPPWAREFEKRFDLVLATAYGSTEVVSVAWQPAPSELGELAGKPRSTLEVIVADEDDRPVPPGEVGEILVRPRRPYEMMDGYYKDPALTLSRLSNFWFHTHDLGWFDSAGNLYYKGRKGDMLRRKGENISPLQIENALVLHSEVLECAVVGVPSDFLDDEIMAVVRLREPTSTSAKDILSFCKEKLPSFMVPRYLYLATEPLPRSASGKVAKYQLEELHKSDRVLDRASLQ